MLTRALSLVAALLLAAASVDAHAYARPLQPESARRGFAAESATAPRARDTASADRIKEKCRAPLKCASSLPVDAWGNVESEQVIDAELTTKPNRIGFTGYQLDRQTSESGDTSYYAKARHYSAGSGSFLSVDPWSGDANQPLSYNKYLYAYANPGAYVDPDGRQSVDIATMSCDEAGSCGRSVTSSSALQFMRPDQMATPEQADALTEAQLRMSFFAPGRPNDPLVVAPLVATGAARFETPAVQYGSSDLLSSMQSSADLDRGLGLPANYVPYGTGTNAVAGTVIGSLPPVAYVNGIRTILNAENGLDTTLGVLESGLAVAPLAAMKIGMPRPRVVRDAGIDPALIAEQRMALVADNDFGPLNHPPRVQLAAQDFRALRRASPTPEIRAQVNAVEGSRVDPVYGYDVSRFQADHIYSLKRTTELPGFPLLSRDSQVSVLNTPQNFMGVGGPTNASRGSKTWSEWQGHSKLGPVPTEVRESMVRREREVSEALRNEVLMRYRNEN